MFSFNASKNAQLIEVDLALFYQRSRYSSSKSDLVFVECKSHSSYEKEDIARMKSLADTFPGAILVFASMNSELSDKDNPCCGLSLNMVVGTGERTDLIIQF